MATKTATKSKVQDEIHKIRENTTKDTKGMSAKESVNYWKTNIKEGMKKENYKIIHTTISHSQTFKTCLNVCCCSIFTLEFCIFV